MKALSFSQSALFGLILSVVGASLFYALQWLLNSEDSLMITLSIVSGIYILWLVFKGLINVGKFTTISLFSSGIIAIFILGEPLLVLIGFVLFSFWLVRCIFFHRALFASFADGILVFLGGLAAMWAISISASILLAFWCFFLVQSLFIFIPKNWLTNNQSNASQELDHDNQTFERAYFNAKNAIRRINEQA